MATNQVVSGLGILTTFWKKVESAIREAGGTDEHIARLAKKDSDLAIRQFAQKIVNGAVNVTISFADQIRVGQYDYHYGYASTPELIQGQHSHLVRRQVDWHTIDHCDTYGYIPEMYSVATLSELLDFGMRDPAFHTRFGVCIVWKHNEEVWYAAIVSGGSKRGLVVCQVHEHDRPGSDMRLLVVNTQ